MRKISDILVLQSKISTFICHTIHFMCITNYGEVRHWLITLLFVNSPESCDQKPRILRCVYSADFLFIRCFEGNSIPPSALFHVSILLSPIMAAGSCRTYQFAIEYHRSTVSRVRISDLRDRHRAVKIDACKSLQVTAVNYYHRAQKRWPA